MSEIKLVVGRQYRLQITGNEGRLSAIGLGAVTRNAQEFENAIVTIRKVTPSRAYIKESIYVPDALHMQSDVWYWPPQCFKPIEVELVLGSIYTVDEIPKVTNARVGWVSDMDSWCKKRLICKALKKTGDGKIYAARMALETSPCGIGWTFLKEWVRLITAPKPKTVKRNVLNFWPGNK